MIGPIQPFNTIGEKERMEVNFAMKVPLSGYLAGKERGGLCVRALEDAWAEQFRVKHAIACNSATSGLLAAAFAVGLKPGDQFVCPAMTMSATAAAPMFTGATPFFVDVEDETFGVGDDEIPHDAPIFVTNLFGHPARLNRLRKDCDAMGTVLIEDNSQSPFALEGKKFAGTVGHIGVFSFNVHKPLQCGEGGMIVTDDDHLADRMRSFINHGEHRGREIGLNLRLPEVCAAISLVQLRRGKDIIDGRVEQARQMIDAITDLPGLRLPIIRDGCSHSFYCIPFLVEHNRDEIVSSLISEGVPLASGYTAPLYRMPAFAAQHRACPTSEALHDSRLFIFENCAYDLTSDQIKQVGCAFQRVMRRWT